jgi:hypothetical protein
MDWLGKVPATFWGVLAGSFFTLLGLWFTNRANATRLEQQFAHERRLKTEERELALRRDVYLPAAEAVSAGLAMVGRLADLSVPQEKFLEEWVTRSPVMARASLVATERTLEALTRFQTRLTSKVISLIAIRVRLTLGVDERKTRTDELNQLTSKNDDDLAVLDQMKKENVVDPPRLAALMRDFDSRQVTMRVLLEKHEKLNKELVEGQLRFGTYAKRLSESSVSWSHQCLPPSATNCACRSTAETFDRIVREARQSAAADLDAFYEEVRSIVTDAHSQGT